MKNILIYHRFASELAAGDCYQPLMFIAELQRNSNVTMLLNRDFDIAGAAQKFAIPIDPSRLAVKKIKPAPFPRMRHFRAFHEARQIRAYARKADICISTTGIIDFGKPAHYFICGLNNLGGHAFYDHVHASNIKTRTGIRRLLRKVGTWLEENVAKPMMGIRPMKKITGNPLEHIYPTSRYVENVMSSYFGPFNSTIFYPPTTFDFSAANVPRNPLRVVYVGRIFPEKRLTDILTTVERARLISGKDIELHIAGQLIQTPYVEKLKRLAGERPWARLVGPAYGADKEALMLSASYAIHAERDEAFGISVSEYLKAGAIPIGPDEGGTTEIVDSPALTYRTNEEAAQILVHLIDDDAFREELRRHCAERAKEFTRNAYMVRQHALLAQITESTGHLDK